MGGEGVDMGEGGVLDAGGRMAVVQQFADIRPAGPHLLEPGLDQPAQLMVRRREPGVDVWVAPRSAGKPTMIMTKRPPLQTMHVKQRWPRPLRA